MFTGHVGTIGNITHITPHNKHVHATIMAAYNPDLLIPHHHLLCDGIALPILEKGAATGNTASDKRSWFTVEISPIFLETTMLGQWKKGHRINLELPLTYGSQITGHLVSGRPDACIKLLDIQHVGDTHQLFCAAPKKLAPFLVEQGNITLNGVSLGIYHVNELFFSTYVIPTLWEFTTLCSLKPGDKIHAEVDTLARYAARLVQAKQTGTLIKH